MLQVCPQAADVVELFIYLSEPCHVCQLLLTVSHGADDLTSPSTIDVRTGRDLDGLKIVLEVSLFNVFLLLYLNLSAYLSLDFAIAWNTF